MTLLFDQPVHLLRRQPARERERWLRAHGQACYQRLPRRAEPPRWTTATVVGGVVTYCYDPPSRSDQVMRRRSVALTGAAVAEPELVASLRSRNRSRSGRCESPRLDSCGVTATA